jgi:uncharacterized protein YndB with AHSA1/START domain
MTVTSSGTAVLTLPREDQILVEREFAAPRHLVYKVWTTPELVKRWWHAKRGTATVADIDLRVGGRWRWVMVLGEECPEGVEIPEAGMEIAFHGEYREIVPNERLVYTEVFEGIPDGDDAPTVNTLTFTENDGHTTVTILTQCVNREQRDAILETGMEEAGLQDALDLLEEVAISLA